MSDDELRRQGRALTPEQKRHVLDRVLDAWLRAPSLRLGQLLTASLSGTGVELFVIEDEILAKRVDTFVSADEARYKPPPHPIGARLGASNVALRKVAETPLMTRRLDWTPSELRVKRLHADARLPTYATEGSSGLDLYAINDFVVRYGEMTSATAFVATEIPPGHEAQVRGRSGLSRQGVLVMPGTVDLDYRGPIGITMTLVRFGEYHVKAGDRIAQLVIAPVARVQVVEVAELSDTARGAGGFGSSGR